MPTPRRLARHVAAERVALAGLLGLALLVRLPPLLLTPGYDVRDYRVWARIVDAAGIGGAYSASFPPGVPWINYPPVYLYVLRATAWLYATLRPDGDWDDQTLAALLKLCPVLAELALGLLLYRVLLRHTALRPALLGTAAFLHNPALVWNTAYWGGIDAIYALFLAAALFAAGAGHPERAWPLAALAMLTKPLALPGALATLPPAFRVPVRRRTVGAGAAIAVALLVTAPLTMRGESPAMVRAMLRNVGNQPAVSANAHNLWWLVTGGDGWRYDTDALLPGLSYRVAGFILLGAIVAWALARLWPRAGDPVLVWLTGAFLTYAAFLVMTEVHENWSVAIFAPLAAAATLRPRYRALYLVLTLTTLANLAIHDPPLRRLLGPGFDSPARVLGLLNAAAGCVAFVWWAAMLARTGRCTAPPG